MKQLIKNFKRFVALNVPAMEGIAKPVNEIAEIFKKPLDNFAKLSPTAKTRNRKTQVKKDDHPIELIKKTGEWYLGRLKDKTLGYVHESEIVKVVSDQWSVVSGEKTTLDAFVNKYMGTPYLLGGTTEQGIDCSGLMQRIYREVYGVELPKNSRDQAKKGRTVKNKLELGDAIFFSAIDKDEIKHVGFLLDPVKMEVLHSPENVYNKVIVEPLAEMMNRYKIVVVKRYL